MKQSENLSLEKKRRSEIVVVRAASFSNEFNADEFGWDFVRRL